jgi:hypothetical protein
MAQRRLLHSQEVQFENRMNTLTLIQMIKALNLNATFRVKALNLNATFRVELESMKFYMIFIVKNTFTSIWNKTCK